MPRYAEGLEGKRPNSTLQVHKKITSCYLVGAQPPTYCSFATRLIGKLVICCSFAHLYAQPSYLVQVIQVEFISQSQKSHQKNRTTCSLGIGKPLETPPVARFGWPNEKYGKEMVEFEWDLMRWFPVKKLAVLPQCPQNPQTKTVPQVSPKSLQKGITFCHENE